VTAWINGVPFATKRTVTFTTAGPEIDPTDPDQAAIAAAPDRLPADGVSRTEVKVTLKYADGRAAIGHRVVLAHSAGELDTPVAVDRGDGTYTATLTSATTPGAAQLSFRVDEAIALARTVVIFTTADTVDPSHDETRLTVTAGSQPADGVSQHMASVKAVNTAGVPVAGATLRFAATDAMLSAETCQTTADGTCTVTITAENPGDKAITATTMDGVALNGSPGTVRFGGVVDVNHPETRLMAGKNDALADGVDTNTLLVQLRDNRGVPIAGRAVEFRHDGAATPVGGARASVNAVTDASGNASVNLVSQVPETFAAEVLFDANGDGVANHPVVNGVPTMLTFREVAPTQLRVSKQASTRTVRVGDLVRYTVVVENVGTTTASEVTLIDSPAPGFSLVADSLQVAPSGQSVRVTGLSPFRVEGLTLEAGERAQVSYLLRVGAGVQRGQHRNRVEAQLKGNRISNEASAVVSMEGDPMLEESLLFGSVYEDHNGNGYQDDGEPGIPGARVISAGGFVTLTDVHGRYHLRGIDVQNSQRGRNFILKLDTASLPEHSQVTTPNPLVKRITQGLPTRFDFGVQVNEVRP